jgi:hypothetical protein
VDEDNAAPLEGAIRVDEKQLRGHIDEAVRSSCRGDAERTADEIDKHLNSIPGFWCWTRSTLDLCFKCPRRSRSGQWRTPPSFNEPGVRALGALKHRALLFTNLSQVVLGSRTTPYFPRRKSSLELEGAVFLRRERRTAEALAQQSDSQCERTGTGAELREERVL